MSLTFLFLLFTKSAKCTKLNSRKMYWNDYSAFEMHMCGCNAEVLRAGTDYQDWRLGIQLAIDGKVAPMFDLHKSRIVDVGDNSDAYEKLLVDSATMLLRQYGPQPAGVPPASPR